MALHDLLKCLFDCLRSRCLILPIQRNFQIAIEDLARRQVSFRNAFNRVVDGQWRGIIGPGIPSGFQKQAVFVSTACSWPIEEDPPFVVRMSPLAFQGQMHIPAEEKQVNACLRPVQSSDWILSGFNPPVLLSICVTLEVIPDLLPNDLGK